MASELELLKSNREELVRKIRLVKPFLDRLLQHGEIVEEEYDTVLAEKIPQDRARALLDLVGAKGGRGAFRHFREHLKKDNPELEEVLHRCAKHNLRYKLYCEECRTLLCRTCRSEDHKQDHRISSVVEDADIIRRDVTAFMRENRKLLKTFKTSSNGEEGRQKLLFDIETRKNTLKAMFITKIESEFEWCRNQLGARKRDVSPVGSISSIASSTMSDLSTSYAPEIESTQPLKARTPERKFLPRKPQFHPYERKDSKDQTEATTFRPPSSVSQTNGNTPVVIRRRRPQSQEYCMLS
ncbi:PREDICTED: uncharacterized protein LOC109476342 [Branchiostoma belcheri]|uniref:Uncharacterized protein LOC109476342 n=1 Tax=Branchiostoma belcheri TaxID=7741 RepID=A0A6P4ZPB8_BRABE|nr:PREDICTED: uncharacterized protein LOC109476342 [Branchiostoma belcheri]